MQLFAGLEAGIEGATHAVGKWRLERVRARRSEEEVRSPDKEEGSVIVVGFNNLNIETAGTEEEATEVLKAVLQMEVDGDGEEEGEGEEWGVGTQEALGALDLLTQDADMRGKMLVDARNGFNELSRLAML